MSRDDPFGLSEDRERTRIRLTGAPMPRPLSPPPVSPAAAGAPVKRSRAHANGLVNAFSPLLEFAPELESALPPDNPEALRTRLLDELVRARDAAVAAGFPLTRADQAAWVVAALLDDLALNTPWGGASAWPRQPLVVMLRGDVDAGTQFFTRLEELERNPNQDRELLELQYLCLALGFRGKYRVPGRAGDRSLNAVRVAAARFLRNADAEERPLSPNWRGVTAADEPPRFNLSAPRKIKEPYVCIAAQSSSQAKYWNNPYGWFTVVKFLKDHGYRVLCIDKAPIHGCGLNFNHIPYGAEDFTGDRPLQERVDLIKDADFFVGLSSGLSWLAWGCHVPVVMISGFTHPTNEFATPYRVINYHTCHSCWNDMRIDFDHYDFLWCPRHKGTDRHFECTRLISAEQVITTIKKTPAFQPGEKR